MFVCSCVFVRAYNCFCFGIRVCVYVSISVCASFVFVFAFVSLRACVCLCVCVFFFCFCDVGSFFSMLQCDYVCGIAFIEFMCLCNRIHGFLFALLTFCVFLRFVF